jgi:2-phosphoglycerate kinase
MTEPARWECPPLDDGQEEEPGRGAPRDQLDLAESGSLPFSKGLTAQALMATGLSPERAYTIAAALEQHMRVCRRGAATIADLRYIALRQLGDEAGEALMRRLESWRRVRSLDRPLVILVGGTTGVGKSTMASQMANRLGIYRLTSTDTVRQVMRAFFSAELMPAIHFSSFDSANAVSIPVPEEMDLTTAGFIEQVKAVRVGIEAVVRRAIEEKQSLVVEGVHLVPGSLNHARWGDAIVVEFVVAITDAQRHHTHFTARDWQTGGQRPFRKYVEHFEQIRRIQEYIVLRARQYGVRVLENENFDDAVMDGMDEVLRVVDDVSGERPAAR